MLAPLKSPLARLVPKSAGVHSTGRLISTNIKSSIRPQHHYHFPRKQVSRRNYSTVVVQDRPRGRTRRIFTSVLLGFTSFATGAYLALSYAPPLLTSLVMGSIPSDEDTLKYEAPDAWTKELDDHIKNCKLARTLRADPEWREQRPHLKLPPEVASHNLTASTLSGPDMIAVPPYYFSKKDGSQMYAILYVGTHVSGHPGIVHGGFLATMLDEGLARCAFAAMPNKVGVTAQLNISYRKPTMAAQFIVLAATTTKVEGRKAWAEGEIYSLDDFENATAEHPPTPLVQADALFIEPKHAKVLKSLYRAAT